MRYSALVLLLAPVRGWTEGQLPAGACAPGSVQSCAPAGVFTTAPAPGHGTAQVPGSESFTFTAADVVHSSEPPRDPELSGAVPFAPGEWTVPPWDGPWRDGDGTLPGMIPGWTTPDPVALNTTGTFAIGDIRILRLNSALVNVIRTNASDINVTSDDGSVLYQRGVDYSISL